MAQLLSNLPVGAKVKFGKYSVNGETAQDIIWLVVAKNHGGTPAYPSNSITFLTEKVIDIRAFDAAEPNSSISDRRTWGNDRYAMSNIDQWLNKASEPGQWYSPTHDTDQSPIDAHTHNTGTGYEHRPGFLNAFSAKEIRAILDTTIRTILPYTDGGGYEDVVRKVFIPSYTEIGNKGLNEGGLVWEYFRTNSIEAGLTLQARNNSRCSPLLGDTNRHPWWLRSTSAAQTVSAIVYIADQDDTSVNKYANMGNIGVRPSLNLSSTLKISDTTDSEGCYTFIWNATPFAPTSLNYSTIYGGKSNTIYWSGASDPDGDTLTYQLECSVNGGAYTQIYRGTATSYPHLVTFGTTSVSYRVKAIDPSGDSSEYFVSPDATVINNYAPVISGADSNLGVKSKGFTGAYTVTDANNNVVTITEAIDGVQIRSLVATLGSTITYSVTDNTWLALSNGSHTLTIRATDGIDTTVRTYTFTKLVDSFTIQTSKPWDSIERPSRIMLVVTRNIPSTATFKVEVCNNGYDVYPTWEDATDAVRSGLVHVFTNNTNVAGKWGVRIKVTVERNGATGACYISAIGGNFE